MLTMPERRRTLTTLSAVSAALMLCCGCSRDTESEVCRSVFAAKAQSTCGVTSKAGDSPTRNNNFERNFSLAESDELKNQSMTGDPEDGPSFRRQFDNDHTIASRYSGLTHSRHVFADVLDTESAAILGRIPVPIPIHLDPRATNFKLEDLIYFESTHGKSQNYLTSDRFFKFGPIELKLPFIEL